LLEIKKNNNVLEEKDAEGSKNIFYQRVKDIFGISRDK